MCDWGPAVPGALILVPWLHCGPFTHGSPDRLHVQVVTVFADWPGRYRTTRRLAFSKRALASRLIRQLENTFGLKELGGPTAGGTGSRVEVAPQKAAGSAQCLHARGGNYHPQALGQKTIYHT